MVCTPIGRFKIQADKPKRKKSTWQNRKQRAAVGINYISLFSTPKCTSVFSQKSDSSARITLWLLCVRNHHGHLLMSINKFPWKDFPKDEALGWDFLEHLGERIFANLAEDVSETLTWQTRGAAQPQEGYTAARPSNRSYHGALPLRVREEKATPHKINHFKANNSAALSEFTMLCSPHL